MRVRGESMRDVGIFDGKYPGGRQSLHLRMATSWSPSPTTSSPCKKLYCRDGPGQAVAGQPRLPWSPQEGQELRIWGVGPRPSRASADHNPNGHGPVARPARRQQLLRPVSASLIPRLHGRPVVVLSNNDSCAIASVATRPRRSASRDERPGFRSATTSSKPAW